MTLRLKAGNKFGARKTTVDGITFASKAEAKRYGELKLLQQAGVIANLTVQPPFELVVNGHHICAYRADFGYLERAASGPDGDYTKTIVEDVKSAATITPVYKIKRALMKACYGITIRETRAR